MGEGTGPTWQLRADRIFSFGRGIFALFFRSLRTESRSLRIHLLWFALMLVIYATLWIAQLVSNSFSAPGLTFFRYVMFLDAAFVSLLGISFFSTVISEEKEEDTLGLMTMAGISPLGILLGKSTSRLFQVTLLLAIQYPFTLLAVTMGGLLPTQVFASYVSLLSYTILLANVGLLSSVACRTNRNASGLTTFWLLGYGVGPLFAYGGFMYLTTDRGWSQANPAQNIVLTALDLIYRSSIFVELYSTTETNYQFSWSIQNVGNALGGLACFLIAWPLFSLVAKDPSPETSSRGMVARRTSRRLWWLSAGRAWSQSLIWKDFFFVAGGWAGLIVRSLLYFGLYLLCVAANRPWRDSGITMRWEEVTYGFQVFAHPLLAVDIALCMSRVFHDEIKGQTLPSLLMLPTSTPVLVYSKLAGCLLATLPGMVALAFSMIALPGGATFIPEVLDKSVFWWWLMNLVFMIHLTALLSLYLRSGAFVLAIGTMIGTMIMTVVVLETVGMMIGFQQVESVMAGVALLLGLLSIACHAFLQLRMPELGKK